MIITTTFETDLGIITAGSFNETLCLLEFNEPQRLSSELNDLSAYFNAEIRKGENAFLETVKKELLEYFKGTRKVFSVALNTPGTEFRQSVWRELLKIPYGTTRSYHQQSVALGSPKAIRAVAAANGMNRIAIIIPCHRVIGSDGSLTGYGGGIERKKWLLEHEKKHSGKAIDQLLF